MNNLFRLRNCSIGLLPLLLMAGCQTPQPYDYTALQASQPRSILVIPPRNQTVEVNAPYTFISTVTRPLAEKGYYIYPVAVIDQLFKENGLPTPEEMNSVPLDRLQQITGADAVLYVDIVDWGQKYEVFQSRTVANSNWQLVDARSGQLLWQTTAFWQVASGDGGGGLAGMLVNAIVEQVASSIIDQTPQVSSAANSIATNNAYTGLLPGPYCQSMTQVPTCTPPTQ